MATQLTTSCQCLKPRNIESELKNKTEYFELPSRIVDVHKYALKNTSHIGMKMVWSSMQAHRSCNAAIIFIYGISGAGKTASLNHLFGSQVISICCEERKSSTKVVTEYSTVLRSDKYKISNLRISFIDMPGWLDTRGEQQDARNIASIDTFIHSHAHLGSKLYKCYPNVILLAVSLGDKRIDEPNSPLGKMLRALSKLGIVDKEKPNVLFILTHADGVPKKNFTQQINSVTNILIKQSETNLGIKPSVVYVENEFDSCDLQVDNDWTILKDETRQPRNVFTAIQKLLDNADDLIGYEAVGVYFASRGNIKPEVSCQLSSCQISLEKERKWYDIIIKEFKVIMSSEISEKIEIYSKEVGKSFKPLIYELSKSGYNHEIDIKYKSLCQIETYLNPFRLSCEERQLLIELFDVKPFNHYSIISKIGTGNRLASNECTKNNILVNTNDYRVDGGITVPLYIKVETPIQKQVIYCDSICQDISTNQLLDAASVMIPIPTSVKCNMLLTQKSLPVNLTRENEYNYTFIFKISEPCFTFSLALAEGFNFYFSNEFKDAIHLLPNQALDNEGKVNIEYIQLFEKFGDMITISQNCGGYIQGEFNLVLEKSQAIKIKEIIKNYLRLYLINLSCQDCSDAKLINEILTANMLEVIKSSNLEWKGGKNEKIIPNLSTLTEVDWNTWINSISSNPIILEDSDKNQTIPIYKLIHFYDQSIAKEVKLAFNSLYPDLFLPTDLNQQLELNDDLTPLQIPIKRLSSTGNGAEIDFGIKTRLELYKQGNAKKLDDTYGGFPPCSEVIIGKDLKDCKKISLRDLKFGDYIMCLDRKQNITFQRVVTVKSNENEEYIYIQISHAYGSVKVANRHNIMHTQYKDMTLAKNIRVGEDIYFLEHEKKILHRVPVLLTKLVLLKGNYIPEVLQHHETFNIIIDGTPCGDEDACFPGNSKVILKGGDKIPINQLQLGQSVLSVDMKTNKLLYTKVYLWAHRQPHTVATFLRIVYQGGAAITLTHNHLLPTKNDTYEHCTRPKMLPASQLKVGDIIYTTNATSSNMCATPVRVLSISTCTQTGYYAPLTNNSVIVVDGVVASVFSLPASPNSLLLAEQGKLTKHLSLHTVAHHLFTPLKVASKLGLSNSLNKQVDNWTGIHQYCLLLIRIYLKLQK